MAPTLVMGAAVFVAETEGGGALVKPVPGTGCGGGGAGLKMETGWDEVGLIGLG